MDRRAAPGSPLGEVADPRPAFRIVGFATAVAASLVTLAGKSVEIWPGNPLFPSGHTAYVVAIAVFLVGRDRRWLRWVTPLLALTAVSLVLSVFHTPVDIAGGAIVGLAVAVPLFAWLKRTESRREVAEAEAVATACRLPGPPEGRLPGPVEIAGDREAWAQASARRAQHRH